MGADPTRILRGALAGAAAAGVWALQQPLDKRVFGVDYDDAELLGKTVTQGPAWPLVGGVWHIANGAVFGSGAGGQQLMIDNYDSMKTRGPRTVAPTFIANALTDHHIGLEECDNGVWNIFFANILLAKLDVRDYVIRG